MTDLRKAAEMMAYEVPLHELLEGVPENARLVIDSEDGMSTSFIPVGLYCKRAASALRQALAQPKREWVGLTDEELEPLCDLWRVSYGSVYVDEFARAIEAKLKEKNSG